MKMFNYYHLNQEIEMLKLSGINHYNIGQSFLGETIYAFHLGPFAGPQIFVEAGIHAREYIATLATIKEIKRLKKYESRLDFGVYFVPLVNPDGARLVIDGIDFIKNPNLKKFLINTNCGNTDFSQWKANILGVDLNSNYNALWGLGAANKFSPAPAGFVGFYPNSEIENINLLKFVATHPVLASLSIHTKGEVVFWGYDGLSPAELCRDESIAVHLARHLGFSPQKTYKSVGGFSDYMSDVYHIPAFTIELGSDKLSHPIGIEHLTSIGAPLLGIVEQTITAIKKLNL